MIFRAYQLGAVFFYVGLRGNVLEFTPPLTLSRAEAEEGVALDGCEMDVGHAHASPSTLDGGEDFWLLGDEGLLLFGGELEDTAALFLAGEVAKMRLLRRKSGWSMWELSTAAGSARARRRKRDTCEFVVIACSVLWGVPPSIARAQNPLFLRLKRGDCLQNIPNKGVASKYLQTNGLAHKFG